MCCIIGGICGLWLYQEGRDIEGSRKHQGFTDLGGSWKSQKLIDDCAR